MTTTQTTEAPCPHIGASMCGCPSELTQTTTAQPRPGTVRDSYGDPCNRATADRYPLRALCGWCAAPIDCQDGTASWGHRRTGQTVCGR